MDILKRELAPISDKAWNEIDGRAIEVLKTYLSARKVVNVDGPKGWEYNFIPEGRLTEIQGKEGDVKSGVYKATPLVEARISFDLNKWELDNITRGAKDIDLKSLEEAVKKIALFEEKAIYNGNSSGKIKGLTSINKDSQLEFGKNASEIMESIVKGTLILKKAYTLQPYTLIVGQEALKRINTQVHGESMVKRLESLLKTEIVYSHVLEGAILVPYDSSELILTIGKDFSIGYS